MNEEEIINKARDAKNSMYVILYVVACVLAVIIYGVVIAVF